MEFERKPKDPDCIIKQIELPKGHAILIANAPDYVNLPQELMTQLNLLKRVNVIDVAMLVFNGRKCVHYKLDVQVNGRNLWVAKSDQFYWHVRGI